MNLHGTVRGAITAVNPDVVFTIQQSTGYSVNAAGRRTPLYATVTAPGQMQAMSGSDLRQVDGLNLNGTKRSIYFYGEVDAIVRSMRKGGDVVIDPKGNAWLVAMVLEQWPDWCKVAVVLQNEASAPSVAGDTADFLPFIPSVG